MAIPDSIRRTHEALFDLWFPTGQLPIPPQILPEIRAIAAGVSAGLLDALAQGDMMAILTGLTQPQGLPFYNVLKGSSNPAVQRFLAATGGFGGLDRADATSVFSFFFDGPAAPASAEVAMLCRETYLSAIWGLPLAVPLTGIQAPATFVGNPAVYAKLNAPTIPPGTLVYDPKTQTIRPKKGTIDYLVIGAGPAGATVAHELQKNGKRVVLIEQGPFVVWGSMDTMSHPKLMFRGGVAATSDNGVLVRSGEAVGGGTTVNIDLAFSPLEATIQSRISHWIDQGWIDGRFYTQERISSAYQWVRNIIGTRQVTQEELNRDNRVLWEGAGAYGVDPSLYHLNRFPQGDSPSPVTQKRDAARQLIRLIREVRTWLDGLSKCEGGRILGHGSHRPVVAGS
ncbi:FAD-dependent oxidoreductase [Zavarzinella formosa]|uniref:FAD-dependent oxidoreductase n=1 Tax=Zavarzinella formosa TaxID=360055 RepID=UPI0002DB3AA5|nr:FAD-dependent oxidoreductase [Zavarzinella formosa]